MITLTLLRWIHLIWFSTWLCFPTFQITLTGFTFLVLSALLGYIYSPRLDTAPPRWVHLAHGLLLFLYQVCETHHNMLHMVTTVQSCPRKSFLLLSFSLGDCSLASSTKWKVQPRGTIPRQTRVLCQC
jgi:hypothetical protein